MISRPISYPLWTFSGPNVIQPPSPLAATGWTPGTAPDAQHHNWLFGDINQWIQYLDQSANAQNSQAEILPQIRLINGGFWSWNLGTKTLAWSSAFNLSIPGIADADNQAAAGSVTLNDGDVAYFMANIPFFATGNTQFGMNVLTGITEAQAITTGQAVTGTNIPASTTVTGPPVQQSDGTFNVPISNNATGNGTNIQFTFAGTSALSVLSTPVANLGVAVNTIVLARRVGSAIVLGVGSGQMVLQDGESKQLLYGGYLTVFTAVAGENLTQGQAVYLSAGASDGGRTAGDAYRTDPGVTNGAKRSFAAGFVVTGVSSGGTALIVSGGAVPLFSSLVVGSPYYLDPTTLGGVTSTKPTSSGQFIVPIGVASSATTIQVTPGFGAEAAVVPSATGFNVATPTLPYTINASTDNQKLFQVSLSSPGQINLPAPTANFIFYVKDTNGSFAAFGLTIHRFATENIENLSADYVLQADYGIWAFYSDGTNWYIGD